MGQILRKLNKWPRSCGQQMTDYDSSLGSLAPEAPDYSAILLPIFSKRVLHIMSPAHRYHYRSMGCKPGKAWLSHAGS